MSPTGIEIVSDYKFYIEDKHPYIMWKEREWKNGYNEDNISENGETKNCDSSFEGSIDYQMVSSFDPNLFASPRKDVALELWMYGRCHHRYDTQCEQGCKL